MRALIHHSFGDPAEVLVVEERPDPEPGPGQVLIRTRLATIHNHDLWTVRGTYGYKPTLPAKSGTEAVGTVEALGEGVTGIEVGQRVALGGMIGTWAELFVTKASSVLPVPESIPDEAAAQLVAMPFSAVSLLDSLDLEPGQWLIQNAANGAVGRLIIQFGAARGINVISLVRRSDGVAEMAAAGFDRVVATDSDHWQDEVARLTGGAPIAVGIDSVGGSATGDLADVLGEGGTLVIFGAMNSPTMEISSGPVIFKELTVKGFWGNKVSAEMPVAKRVALLTEVVQRVASGEVSLPVAGVFALDDIRQALAEAARPGRPGKVLLRP